MTPALPNYVVADDVLVFRFDRHDKIVIEGKPYRWIRADDLGHVLVADGDTRHKEWIHHNRIYELYMAGTLTCHRDVHNPVRNRLKAAHGTDLLTDFSPEDQELVLWRERYCIGFFEMERSTKGVSRSDKSLQNTIPVLEEKINAEDRRRFGAEKKRCGQTISHRAPPNPSTFRKWLRSYEAAEYRAVALRDRYGKSGNRTPRIDADSQDAAQAYAAKFMSSNRPNKKMIFIEYSRGIELENKSRTENGRALLHALSRRSFEKLISQLDPYATAVAREGEDAARRKFGIVQGGLVVSRPNERVEMDEWRVSLQTLLVNAGVWAHLSPEGRAAVQRTRVWLSAAICARTRYILALRLLDAAPSHESAIATLEMALCEKTHITSVVGTLSTWRSGGIETVAMDSGSSFTALATRAVMADAGIEAFFPPSGLKEMRARVERSFRTIQQQLVRYFAGQTFENLISKGSYDSEGNATINVEELNRTLVRYVVDAYHNTPHEGLSGETPENAWLRLSKKFSIIPPPDKSRRRHIFGISCERVIQNKGIRVLGIHYQSKELQQLRRKVQKKPVLVRVDRFDLQQISVRVDGGWLSVGTAIDDLNLTGVSYWEWVSAARELSRHHAEISALSADIVTAALDHVRALGTAAVERAELGSPILVNEDIDKLDRDLFRTFSFSAQGAIAVGDPIDDASEQYESADLLISSAPSDPAQSAAADHDADDADFGSDDDYI
jgi:putative transposase